MNVTQTLKEQVLGWAVDAAIDRIMPDSSAAPAVKNILGASHRAPSTAEDMQAEAPSSQAPTQASTEPQAPGGAELSANHAEADADAPKRDGRSGGTTKNAGFIKAADTIMSKIPFMKIAHRWVTATSEQEGLFSAMLAYNPLFKYTGLGDWIKGKPEDVPAQDAAPEQQTATADHREVDAKAENTQKSSRWEEIGCAAKGVVARELLNLANQEIEKGGGKQMSPQEIRELNALISGRENVKTHDAGASNMAPQTQAKFEAQKLATIEH